MKSQYKNVFRVCLAAGFAMCMQSCVSEDPFASGGEGTLRLSTEIRSEVTTRSSELTQDASLREKCVVYIETSRGVIRKFKGLDNIPALISLKSGKYIAEAWTGDSVSASFDKKFYRAKEEFTIADGDNKVCPLVCNIANVVVSVNPDALKLGLSNLKVTFSHSRGSLEFTEDNIPLEKGYFMMPNADKDLSYKVEGDKSDGSHMVKEGTIPNVQRAHEYILNITSEAGDNPYGGALFRICPSPTIGSTLNGVSFPHEKSITEHDRIDNIFIGFMNYLLLILRLGLLVCPDTKAGGSYPRTTSSITSSDPIANAL
jgi:hypothetical protein